MDTTDPLSTQRTVLWLEDMLVRDLGRFRILLSKAGCLFDLPVRLRVIDTDLGSRSTTRPSWTAVNTSNGDGSIATIHVNAAFLQQHGSRSGEMPSLDADRVLQLAVTHQLGAAWVAGFSHPFGVRYWLDLDFQLGPAQLSDVLGLLICHWLYPCSHAELDRLTCSIGDLPPWEDLKPYPPVLILQGTMRCMFNRIGSYRYFRHILENPGRDPMDLVLELRHEWDAR